MYSHHYQQLLLIGDSGVGKSCLLLRFCDDAWTPSFITTIGIDFKIRTIELDGKRIKLQIVRCYPSSFRGHRFLSSLTSGTLLARNGSVPLLLRTTGAPWEFCSSTTSLTSDRLTVSLVPIAPHHILSIPLPLDIRTWHSNIEQHASEGVNKILIGNKSDWNDKRVVTEEQGRELAQELGIQFMETSAKVNEGVEEAFFTLARYLSVLASGSYYHSSYFRDIKTRLIDSQADSANTAVGSTEGSVKISQSNDTAAGGCC